MAVSFIAATVADGASTTATSVAVSYTVQAGDLLLIGVAASANGGTGAGAGDITCSSANMKKLWGFDAFDHSSAVFYRFVQSGDPSSYTFNVTGSGSPIAAISARYSGVDTTTPFRNFNTTVNPDNGTNLTTSSTFPALNNVQANDVVVAWVSYSRGTKANSITAVATPTNWTSRQDNTGPLSTTTFAVWDAFFERLGATDTPTITTQSGQCSICSIALIPASNPVPDAAGGTIAFRNASSAATTTNGATTLNINKPTGVVDGDLMILVAAQTRGVANWSPPAGWLPIETQTGGVSQGTTSQYQNISTRVWYKYASSEGASYTVGCTVTGSTPQHYCLAIVAYSNVRSTNAIKLHGGVGMSSISLTSPALYDLMQVASDNLVVAIYTTGADTTGTYTVTPPSSPWNNRVSINNAKASEFNANIVILDKLAASDRPTASASKSSSWTTHALSLVGAPVSTGPTDAQLSGFMPFFV